MKLLELANYFRKFKTFDLRMSGLNTFNTDSEMRIIFSQ